MEANNGFRPLMGRRKWNGNESIEALKQLSSRTMEKIYELKLIGHPWIAHWMH